MAIIKICGVKDIFTARFCGDLGIEMIGLHVVNSLNEPRQRKFRNIIMQMRATYPYTTPVIVTKITEVDKILKLLASTTANILQIHAPVSNSKLVIIRDEAKKLSENKLVIIVTIAVDDPMAVERIENLKSEADLLLIDSSYMGGTGHSVNISVLRNFLRIIETVPCLIAGGVGKENVSSILKELGPYGVDVESSVTNTCSIGRLKDLIKIREFVSAVRECNGSGGVAELINSYYRTLMSVKFDSKLPIREIRKAGIDIIHLDFLDNEAGPLNQESFIILKRLRRFTPCLPYDLHFHQWDEASSVIELIKKCLFANPLLHSVLLDCSRWNNYAEEAFRQIHLFIEERHLCLGISLNIPPKCSMEELSLFLIKMRSYKLKEILWIADMTTKLSSNSISLLNYCLAWSNKRTHKTFVGVEGIENIQQVDNIPSLLNHIVVDSSLLIKKPVRNTSLIRKKLTPPCSE